VRYTKLYIEQLGSRYTKTYIAQLTAEQEESRRPSYYIINLCGDPVILEARTPVSALPFILLKILVEIQRATGASEVDKNKLIATLTKKHNLVVATMVYDTKEHAVSDLEVLKECGAVSEDGNKIAINMDAVNECIEKLIERDREGAETFTLYIRLLGGILAGITDAVVSDVTGKDRRQTQEQSPFI